MVLCIFSATGDFFWVLCVAVQFCNRNPRKSTQNVTASACKTPKFSPSGGLKWEGKTDKKETVTIFLLLKHFYLGHFGP